MSCLGSLQIFSHILSIFKCEGQKKMNVYFFFRKIKSVYVDAFLVTGHCVQVALCFRGCSSGPAQGNNFISQ